MLEFFSAQNEDFPFYLVFVLPSPPPLSLSLLPSLQLLHRDVFNWVSKVIRNCFGFHLLRSVIVWKNPRHLLNQSDAKLKPIATWSHAFSCAWRSLRVSASSSHWFVLLFTFLWLAIVIIALVLVLLHSIENRSSTSTWTAYHVPVSQIAFPSLPSGFCAYAQRRGSQSP